MSERIDEGILCKYCISKRDFNILFEFIKMANEEGYPFKSVISPEQKVYFLIDSMRRDYIGFLVWRKDQLDKNHIVMEGLDFDSYKHKCCGEILQLIYIIPEERRKGIGSKFIKYWVENVADNTYDLFGVELMGGSFILNVLLKLGYINEKDPEKSHCYLVETGRKAVPKYIK